MLADSEYASLSYPVVAGLATGYYIEGGYLLVS